MRDIHFHSDDGSGPAAFYQDVLALPLALDQESVSSS